MNSLKLIFDCISILFKWNKILFLRTMLVGTLWRFFLILSYVFSISAISMVYQSPPKQNIPFIPTMSVDNYTLFLSIIVIGFFLTSSIFDIAFIKHKGRLASCFENNIGYLKKHDKKESRSEIKEDNKAQVSQILLKCFDTAYAFALCVGTVVLFSIISIYLAIGLVVLIAFSGFFFYVIKNKSTVAIKSSILLGNTAKVSQQKLIRMANIRSLSMLIAGLFLASIVWLLGHNSLQGVSLVQIATIAFCVRFLISFFIILIVNLSALLDSHALLYEFRSISLQLSSE